MGPTTGSPTEPYIYDAARGYFASALGKRGLKGKVVTKKTEEMKYELESAVALVRRYVPPSPDKFRS